MSVTKKLWGSYLFTFTELIKILCLMLAHLRKTQRGGAQELVSSFSLNPWGM